jgi:O-antigen/teichoic acid export membrane protein
MAKKENRRAYRQAAQPAKKGVAGPRQPSINRSMIQGAMIAVVYFVLTRFVFRSTGRSIWADVIAAVFFFFVYSVFIYYWERFLINRRERRKQQSGKK